jgi:HAD superfamily hydrolase (TIGR01509 family)
VTSPAPTLAVLFDLDGVLADTEPLWSRSAEVVLQRRGARFDPGLKPQFMGRHPLEVARIMVKHYDLDVAPEALLHERLTILREIYAAAPIPAVSGARELVQALAAEGVPMAVASGSPGELVTAVLTSLGLIQTLPVHLGSDEVERGKPAPDLFEEAARRLGAAPARCVVVEDAVLGVQAAHAAKMACVALASAAVRTELLAGADRVVGSLTELSPALLARVVDDHVA